MKYHIITILTLILSGPISALAHGGKTDNQGGHYNRETEQYHCHKEPCYSNHKKSSEALQDANRSNRNYSIIYNRKDWPHWIDIDGDCQDTRAEILIRSSSTPVKFKRNKGCVVAHGEWFDVYTGKIFIKASDIDIDHIVPLSHAHKHGAADWNRNQKRSFANDPENLLPVEDNANQSKGDKGPDLWKPYKESYWCEYANRWMDIKIKYELEIKPPEQAALDQMINTCR